MRQLPSGKWTTIGDEAAVHRLVDEWSGLISNFFCSASIADALLAHKQTACKRNESTSIGRIFSQLSAATEANLATRRESAAAGQCTTWWLALFVISARLASQRSPGWVPAVLQRTSRRKWKHRAFLVPLLFLSSRTGKRGREGEGKRCLGAVCRSSQWPLADVWWREGKQTGVVVCASACAWFCARNFTNLRRQSAHGRTTGVPSR